MSTANSSPVDDRIAVRADDRLPSGDRKNNHWDAASIRVALAAAPEETSALHIAAMGLKGAASCKDISRCLAELWM